MTRYSALRLIEATDDLRTFDCGTPSLNEYLRKRALANQTSDLARCYVSTDDSGQVVAFHTLSGGSLLRQELPTRLRKNTPDVIPILVIGRLAVDQKHQGKKLGRSLVRHALERSVEAADIAGSKLIVVHTQNDEARNFWLAFDFDPMPANDWHLMLTVADARVALGLA